MKLIAENFAISAISVRDKLIMMSFANLHIHTFFSDGAISPWDLFDAVLNEEGLDYYAVTDHDSLSAIEPMFRCMETLQERSDSKAGHFIPGIELSLFDENLRATVHMIGLFPHVNLTNYRSELRKIDAVVGDYCRLRCMVRGERDLDARIRHAFEINLEGLADRYESVDEIIDFLHRKTDERNKEIFEKAGKANDVIRHPVPETYQAIVDYWESLMPDSTREKIYLSILRSDFRKVLRLARIYRSDGMNESEALKTAEKNQAALYNFDMPTTHFKGIFEGLDLLKQAGGIAFIAHPAVDHRKIGYQDFDRHILFPLLDSGLDGIEVFYPYDTAYRQEAVTHYGTIARDRGLLISGGTDFHGDGRIGLADVKLDVREVRRILEYKH